MSPAVPSFELLPGAGTSPVILHVPHGARAVPPEVRAGIVLDDRALERELDHIVDAHTAELAERAAGLARATPWRFVNRLSRLVVDPERFPDEREEMLAVGMGAVYTRTTHREALRDPAIDPEPLVERYFRPYARAMTEAVADRLAATGRAVIVDVHSYPTRPLPTSCTATARGPRSAWAPTPSTHPARSSPPPGRRSGRGATWAWTARSAGRTYRWSTTGRTPGCGR